MDQFVKISTQVILEISFILIAEKYGPSGIFHILNNYLSDTFENGPILVINQQSSLSHLPKLSNCMNILVNHLMDSFKSFPSIIDIDESMKLATSEDQWCIFALKIHSIMIKENTIFCLSFLHDSNLTDFKSLFQKVRSHSVYFSIIKPKSKTKYHVGSCKAFLQVWMPIVSSNAYIEFKDHDKINLNLNELILFDNTFEHTICNKHHKPLIVLCLEVLRPVEDILNVTNIAVNIVSKHQLIDESLRNANLFDSEIHSQIIAPSS